MKREIGALKGLTSAELPSLGSPWLLSGLIALYGGARIANILRLANVAVSNVPGPRVPLYFAGARMRSYFPVSIVIHGVALNVTVQSYENQLCFGLLACRDAVPDLPRLAGDLGAALEELGVPAPAAAAAGAAPARQARPRRGAKASSASAAGGPRRRAQRPSSG